MAVNRHPYRLSKLSDRAYDVLKKSQTDYLKTNGFFSADIFSISSDAPSQAQAAIDIANRVTFAIFLQAVIDNDVAMVKKCLEAEPDLITGQPDKNLVVESKRTWQKFYAEPALTMAVKRKQIKMVELLLPYYDKLPQTEDVLKSKAEALSTWASYEIQKNAAGVDEIIIPEEYAAYAQSLINVFIEETFPNGVPGENDIPVNVVLSKQTELTLSSLLNILVPKNAVKLDEHIDVELLLLAIYKAYSNNFPSFGLNWDKLDIFCIRAMGLTQSASIPETAELFCEGFEYVVTALEKGNEKEINTQAAAFKLKDGEAFYRTDRDARLGLGADFFCGAFGGCRTLDGRGLGGILLLEKIFQNKMVKFQNIVRQFQQQPNQHSTDHKPSGCSIS